MTEQQKQAELDDYRYWSAIGKLLGCLVCGYTDRRTALLSPNNGAESIVIPGWMAERILEATRAAEDRGFKLGVEDAE